jgi:hypothetical protein
MQIVIDIPEQMYLNAKADILCGGDILVKAIKNGTPLDKIRAEIEALIEWHDCPIEYDNGNDAWYCEACNQAIKIIDKYKAESEDKE